LRIYPKPLLDESGGETGMFEIPAGGRRYRALELLVKQKRLSKTAPIPCVVRTGGIAEEDSLAENVQRAPLHPLDQFRAFLALREKGQSEEDIAAAFFVAVSVVKQRLRLAAVSPALLEVYAEDSMTLDQLMAFSVSPDHERQEQVWEAIQRTYNKEPYQIRRLLTEGSVRAADKRAQYAGEDYIAAGGAVIRDLFQADDGGWLQDVGLLERVVLEKLTRDAEAVRAEGWKWVEAATEFPYGHTYGLRRIATERAALTDEEIAKVEALRVEAEQIEAEYAQGEELPEEIDRRMGEIEAALEAVHERPAVYGADDLARAGAFVSIDGAGKLRVERGYVRPEDEVPQDEPETPASGDEADANNAMAQTCPAARPNSPAPGSAASNGHAPVNNGTVHSEPDEDDAIRPLSDKLLTELTAYRTLALREALGNDPALAFIAVLHALCLKMFYRYGPDSCLEIETKNVAFGHNAPGLADTPLAARVDARHRNWAEQMPEEPGQLWDALIAFDRDSRDALFAHCASLTVNAVREAYNRRPKAMAHADRLAEALTLDIAKAGWTPTADNYLGRVSKARILDAVLEAKGEPSVELIAHLKKAEMATEAARLLEGTFWLPEPLRTPGVEAITAPPAVSGDAEVEIEALPAFLTKTTGADDFGADPVEAEQEALAAE
jgi:ParB family chromosome partitioning protein